MDERTWDRVGACSGIGFVVLSVLATFLYPQPPRVDSDPAAVLRWAHGHRVGIEAGMAMGIFAALLFVWFASQVRHRLDQGGEGAVGSVAYGSAMAFVAIYALGAVPAAALVFMGGQPGGLTDGAVVRLLIDLNQILFAPAIGLAGVFLLAAGIGMVRTGVLSRSLGWVAVGVSVLNAIEVVTTLTFSSYHKGGWTVVGWASFLGFLVVVLAMGIALVRRAATVLAMPKEPAQEAQPAYS